MGEQDILQRGLGPKVLQKCNLLLWASMSILIPACFFHCGHLSVSGLSDDLVPQTAVGVTVTEAPFTEPLIAERKRKRTRKRNGKREKRTNKRAKNMAKKRRIWSGNKRKITKKRKQTKMF